MATPLQDLRVLDLSSGPVGGIATMVLSDFGAEVVKLERPGGDPLRSLAAAPMWLRGKRSLEADLTSAAGRARLLELSRAADVLVTTFRPSTVERLGADYQTLAAENPGLIYCSITGFGPRGPYAEYPAYEGIVAAKSGRMQGFTGQRRREGPGFAAVPVGGHAASQGALHGIVAALIERERCGLGQIVETSLLQGMLPFDLLQLLLTQLHERQPDIYPQIMVVGGGMPTLNYHPVMTADGRWIQLGNLLEHLFYAFMDAAGLTELFAEEQWQGGQAEWTEEALEAMRDRILERMQERSAEEWMAIFRDSGNVAAEIFTPTHEAVGNRDMQANGDVLTIDDPSLARCGSWGRSRICARRRPRSAGPRRRWARRTGSAGRCATAAPPPQTAGGRRPAARRDHDPGVRHDHRHADRRLDAGRPRRAGDQSGADRRRPLPRDGRRTADRDARSQDQRRQREHLHRPQERSRPSNRGRPDRRRERDRAQLPPRRARSIGHRLGGCARDSAGHRLGFGERATGPTRRARSAPRRTRFPAQPSAGRSTRQARRCRRRHARA